VHTLLLGYQKVGVHEIQSRSGSGRISGGFSRSSVDPDLAGSNISGFGVDPDPAGSYLRSGRIRIFVFAGFQLSNIYIKLQKTPACLHLAIDTDMK